MLRTGYWIKEKIQCDLLVSLGRQLLIKWHFMNWTKPDFNEFEIRLNWIVSLKCLSMTFVLNWPYLKINLNWVDCGQMTKYFQYTVWYAQYVNTLKRRMYFKIKFFAMRSIWHVWWTYSSITYATQCQNKVLNWIIWIFLKQWRISGAVSALTSFA